MPRVEFNLFVEADRRTAVPYEVVYGRLFRRRRFLCDRMFGGLARNIDRRRGPDGLVTLLGRSCRRSPSAPCRVAILSMAVLVVAMIDVQLQLPSAMVTLGHAMPRRMAMDWRGSALIRVAARSVKRAARCPLLVRYECSEFCWHWRAWLSVDARWFGRSTHRDDNGGLRWHKGNRIGW